MTDVVVDPRNPDVVVAAAYQRRRHFFTLINGGPESAIHRSTDGGKTWKKATTGLAGRAARADRAGDLAGEPRRALRQRRSGERQGRDLPLVRQRRHVGEAQRLQPGIDVLRRHLPRPGERRSPLHPRRRVPGVRRRRQDAAVARDAQHARRQSHHLGRSGEHQSPARRQRRRLVSLVRSRRALDLLREPAAAAVLRRRRRQRGALLQHLRRDAGQLLARRTGADAIGARHPERGLVRDAGRRRLRVARRSGGPEHDLRRAAAWRHRPLRQADRRARRHSAAGRERRSAAALELGFAVHHLPAPAHAAVFRRAVPLPLRRQGQQLEGRLAGPDAADRSQHPARDGQDLGTGCGGEEHVDGALRQSLRDCREPEEGRAALRRHRRWPRSGQR